MKAKRTKTKWVDFKEIKEKVGMADILKHYELLDGLKERKNNELVGYCPIHDGEAQYNKNSFCVNTKKNAFNCFACGAGGNVLDFVAQMEDLDIRKAGLLIQGWFNLAPAKKLAKKGKQKSDSAAAEPEKTPAKSKAPDSDEVAVNPVLTFELKDLDQNHPYLKERGLERETIKEFGIGFCKRGLMKNRIAIPIHNENGELVAYAGRFAGDPPADGEPKYILPPKFRKHLVLYNFHRARELSGGKGLVLVEGFFDVMKVWQAGSKKVVALMGASMSDEQAGLLIDALAPDRRLSVMLDPDAAGIKATREIVERLITEVYIKMIDLKDGGLGPDGLSEERIQQMLRG